MNDVGTQTTKHGRRARHGQQGCLRAITQAMFCLSLAGAMQPLAVAEPAQTVVDRSQVNAGQMDLCFLTNTCSVGGQSYASKVGSCTASPGGDPSACEADGPASQSRTDAGSAAGNPIDVATGNKYQKEVDIAALPGVLGLEVVRHYNSRYAQGETKPGILGRGWKLSYETRLYRVGETLQIVQADGTRLIFNRDANNPSQCGTGDATHGRVVIEARGEAETYQWVWTHGASAGRRLYFDERGWLTRIEAPGGEAVSLEYTEAGLLSRVTDPQGRALKVHYPEEKTRDAWRFPGAERIETPAGEIKYSYGQLPEETSLPTYREDEPVQPTEVLTAEEQAAAKKRKSWVLANLERVEWPANGAGERSAVRIYHYEDERYPNLLTGISVAELGSKAERISRYGYDKQGLAKLSERLASGERVELTELAPSKLAGEPGHTVLTDGQGKSTSYRHAQIGGRGRLLETRGAGCPGCSPAERRYVYDTVGREVEVIQLDSSGRAESGVRKEYDDWGRLTGIGQVTYGAGAEAPQWHPLFGVWRLQQTGTQTTEATERVDWLIRYDYAEPHVDSKTGVLLALEKPMRITRPSVVEGKEHRIELEYNDAWQVTKVIETGYSPAVPTNVAHVEPSIPESTDPADDDGFIKTSTASAGLVGWEERSGSQQNSRDNLNSEASVGWAKQAQRSVPTRTAVTNQPEIPTRNTSTNTDGGFVGWEERSGSQQQSAADLVVAKSSGTNISKTTLPEGLQGNFVRAKCSGTLDSTGRSDCPRLITRTTEYRYRKVNGRSVLVAIDGPLPNGSNGPLAMPTDSDIIHIFWDKQGNYPVRVLMPGGVARSVDREASGRVTRLRIEDGYSAGAYGRQLDYRYTAQGKLTQLTEQAWQISENGQPKATLERVLRAGYDAAGRLNRLETPGRIFDETTFVGLRAENRPNESTTGQDVAEGTTSPHLKVDFDAATRRASWLDTAGQSWLRASWGEAGTAAANELLKVESRTGRRAERRVDDFGRVVAIKNPGQGWQTARYDEADRLIETVDPRGAQRVLSYDRRGRLIEISSYAVQTASKPESRINYRYEGGFLREAIIRDEAGERQTHYEHDTFGRILQERQRIEWRSAKYHQAEFCIEYGYDAAGRRSHTTLIDGNGQKSVVRTHYDGQGRVERLALDGRYYGESDLVRVGAYRTIAGHPMATRFEHGNGRIEEWSAALEALEQEARFPNRGSADPYRPVGKQTEGLASFAAYETPDIDVFNNGRLDQAQPGFDAAGLPQSYSGTNGDWALDWNAAGQLVHMKRSVGDEIFFVHDAQGRRVAKQVVTTGETSGQTKTTYFAYDGIQMIGETAAVDSKNIEAQGVIVHRTVYLGYRPVARIDLPGNTGWRTKFSGPEIRAIHTSVSGQALQMTDARQQVLWQETQHLPGGITRISIAGEPVEGWGHQPLRYVGQYHDAETGLSYHGARYFNPHTGRFISPDPAGIADALSGINATDALDLYLYAGGNPERYFDPDGAARITYYLIDTNPTQGGNQAKGRWAFYLRDISGDDREYLYDANGTFLQTNKNPLYGIGLNTKTSTITTSTYAAWSAAMLQTERIQKNPLNAFVEHYALDLISPASFTVDIPDAAAKTIVNDLLKAGDLAHKYYCSGEKNGQPQYKLVFPDVTLGSGADAIRLSPGGREGENDTPGSSLVAQGNDTFACKQAMTPNQAFRVTRAAVEQQETSGRDCSAHGCPGEIPNPLGNSAVCASNPNRHDCPNEPASYGRTQFTVTTFLEEMMGLSQPATTVNTSDPLVAAHALSQRLTQKERRQIGFIDANGKDTGLRRLLQDANNRAAAITNYWNRLRGGTGNTNIEFSGFSDLGDIMNFDNPNVLLDQDTSPNATPESNQARDQARRQTIQRRLEKFADATGLGLVNVANGGNTYDYNAARDYYTRMIRWAEVRRLLNKYRNTAWNQVPEAVRNQALPILVALGFDQNRIAIQIAPYLRKNAIWEEGVQAFRAAAIFAQPNRNGQTPAVNLRALFVTNADSYFKDRARFEIISDRVIQRELTNNKRLYPNETERQIAAMTAYYHNSHVRSRNPPNDPKTYVAGFLTHWDRAVASECGDMTASRFSLDPVRQSTP